MAVKPIDHYSITNIKPSVYEEESMTALELVGRIGQRLNELINSYNSLEEETDAKLTLYNELIDIMNTVTMPEKVKNEVDLHIARGDFDRAISVYLGDLESRVNNMSGSIVEGSTTFDAEIIDARLGGNNVNYATAGEAVRGQYNDLSVRDNDKRSFTAERYGYRYNYNQPSFWEQGWYNSETGEKGDTGSDYTTFIRTASTVPRNVARVISPLLRLEIFVYRLGRNNTNGSYELFFVQKEELRRGDYIFDHSGNLRYKIHATGYEENILNYHSTKTAVTPADASGIYFLANGIIDQSDKVSSSALELGYQTDLNYRLLWSQGYIYGDTGEDGVDPRGYDYWLYSRSDFLPENVEAVAVKAGCKARLFRYDNDEAFVDFVNVSGDPVKLNHDAFRYRLDVTFSTNELGDRNDVCDMWSNVHLLAIPAETGTTPGETVKSPFDKDVYFPPFMYAGYEYIQEELNVVPTDEIELAELYNDIEANFPCWSVEHIGDDSDSNGIHALRWIGTPYVEGSITPNKPKIIIVGGQHGFEKGNVYGLLTLMWAMANAYDGVFDNNAIWNYLIMNVDLIIIPCACPYAFTHETYKNANGVNLNRNYDYKWVKVDDPDSDQYGGEAPFDQPETRAIRDFILAEENVCLVIDSHAKGSGDVTEDRDINWITAPGETDAYYKRMANVAHTHLLFQNREFKSKHEFDQSGYYEGFDGTINTIPSLDNWCVYKNKINSLTFEGHNGYAGEGLSESDVAKRNASMILNFIAHYIAEYSRR